MFEALPYSLPKCVGKECQQRLSRPVICILPTRWHNDVNYQRKLILRVRRRGCCNAIGVGLMRLFEKGNIIDTQGTVCYLNSKGKSASKSSACKRIEWQLSLCRHLIRNDNIDLREMQWAKQTLISLHLHHYNHSWGHSTRNQIEEQNEKHSWIKRKRRWQS